MKLVGMLALGACFLLRGAECPNPHAALKKEIQELRQKPEVLALPPYLPEDRDFDEVCRQAGREGKQVLVCIGREVCGRCQRFYELVRRGEVRVDTNRLAFVRLNIDNFEQREYFMGTFEPEDSHLPFVGVTDAARSETRPCLTGLASVADYRKLVGDARLAAEKKQD